MAGAAEWDSHEAVMLIRYYLKTGGGKVGVQKVGVGD